MAKSGNRSEPVTCCSIFRPSSATFLSLSRLCPATSSSPAHRVRRKRCHLATLLRSRLKESASFATRLDMQPEQMRGRHVDTQIDAMDTFCIDLLRDLVRIPSITGDEKTAQLRLAQRLGELGLEVDVWSPTRSELETHPAFSDDGLPLGDRPVV